MCPECRVKKVLNDAEFKSLTEVIKPEVLGKNRDFYESKGCQKCEDGYEGRFGVYEVLEVTDNIRELIVKRANSNIIAEAAKKEGMTTMLEDGFKKALAGITTIEEILRIVHE